LTLTCLGLALAALTTHNLGVERLRSALYVPACLGTASALVGLAYAAGVRPDELGLSLDGSRAGLAISGAVVLAVAVAGCVPVTRPLFADRRMAGVGRLGTAYRAMVRIPLGTVTLEEVAFRGVLLSLLDRLVPLRWAVTVSCLLFGLWHAVPVRSTLRTNHLPARPAMIGAAVVATGLVGAGLCWLRLTTGGLAAPMLVHASASAAATVVAALVLNRQTGRVAGENPEPPSRDTVARPVGERAAPLAAIALVALLLIVLLAREDEDKGAGAAQTATAPEATLAGAGVVPQPGPVRDGTASNGAAWTLAVGRPSAGLCLTVAVVATDERRSGCGDLSTVVGVPGGKAYEPVRLGDPQVPPFVFGRMPPDVTEVEVIVAAGGSLGRVPALPATGGPFYAVEVTGGSEAISVFGYRGDGTSVRYDLPRSTEPTGAPTAPPVTEPVPEP